MGSDVFRNWELEPDPTDAIIRGNYDAIDAMMEDYKNNPEGYQDGPVYPELWKEEMEELLSDVGIVYDGELPLCPQNQLDRIYSYYGKQGEEMNDDMMYQEVDPIPSYEAGFSSYKRELEKLGYAVGRAGVVGRYYLLLPLINFSRGYWLAKFEKGFEDNNDDMLLEVAQEMKIVCGETEAEHELTRVVNKMFSETDSLSAPKKNSPKL